MLWVSLKKVTLVELVEKYKIYIIKHLRRYLKKNLCRKWAYPWNILVLLKSKHLKNLLLLILKMIPKNHSERIKFY